MNKNEASKKIPTSFKLSDRTKELLRLIAEDDNRSMANMIEVLVEAEAKRRGIKLQ